jgi:hypothetical protein
MSNCKIWIMTRYLFKKSNSCQLLSTIHNPPQMQDMDKKYNRHAWCKLVTTSIKNSFGLGFRKACCLGHLQCVHDDCENFVHYASPNETFWCGECTHILVIGQMAIILSASLLGYKFCHVIPLCFTN